MTAMRWGLVVCVVVATLLFNVVVGADRGAESEEVLLDVQGMTCNSCAARVQQALRQIDGVSEADVSFDQSRARVVLHPARVTTEELIAAIAATGYRASLSAAPVSSEADPEVESASAGGPSCSMTESTRVSDTEKALTDEQVARVVDYVVNYLRAAGKPGALSRTQIEEATNIVVPMGEIGRIQNAALARLQGYPEILARLDASRSRCAEYDACSLDRDLSGASGEVLAMYEREKQEDGRVFENRALPVFEAFGLDHAPVVSEALAGHPAMLVFLAGHCTHSMDTFPILQEMARKYAPDGLRVVGVVVNSGTPEDVATWVSRFEPDYDIWVYTDDSLGDIIESHLVPTYLYVDPEGMVREKLVGYKDEPVVDDWISRLIKMESAVASRSTGAAGTR